MLMVGVLPVRDDFKLCKKCGSEKPATTKYFTKSDGYLCSPCNNCRNEQRRERQSANPEKYKRAYRLQSLKRTYGLSEEEYTLMLEQANSCCEICGKSSEEETKELNVDHCHTTGKIRGLLCGSCNTGLGLLKDSEDILTKAIEYLKRGDL